MKFPFVIAASKRSLDELSGLVDLMEDKLNCEYSDNRKAFFEVINNYIEAKRKNVLYITGPFIGVSMLEDQSLNPVKRITINSKLPVGAHIYSYSELLSLLKS
jgi:hypothetical protein